MVDNYDDLTMPASTLHTWFIGAFFVETSPFTNQSISVRRPCIQILPNAAQFLAFPTGKLLEGILPIRQFTTTGYTWSLNPGKFNLKEHMVITIMVNVRFSPHSPPMHVFS